MKDEERMPLEIRKKIRIILFTALLGPSIKQTKRRELWFSSEREQMPGS